MKRKVEQHLKDDIKTFRKEAAEDKELMRDLEAHYKSRPNANKRRKKEKFETVMHEFKEGELHSGSTKGPKVTKRPQALAIAFSEQRRMKKKKAKKKK